jgi:integrase
MRCPTDFGLLRFDKDLFAAYLARTGTTTGTPPKLPKWCVEESEKAFARSLKLGLDKWTYFARAKYTGRIKIGVSKEPTGLRLGDLVRLDWNHVKDKAIVMVTAKRKKRVVIPILPELRALLDSILGEGAVLKNSRGKPWTSSGLGSVYQKAKGDLSVRIHDLRGTYVTWLCTKGLTDEEIHRIIGWSLGRINDMRARYVDEARVVVSLVERLSAKP